MDGNRNIQELLCRSQQKIGSGYGSFSNISNNVVGINSRIYEKESSQCSKMNQLMLLPNTFTPQIFLSDVNRNIKVVRKRTIPVDGEIEPLNKRLFNFNNSSTCCNGGNSNLNILQNNSQELSRKNSQFNERYFFSNNKVLNAIKNSETISFESDIVNPLSEQSQAINDKSSREKEFNSGMNIFPSIATIIMNPTLIESNTVFCYVPGRLTLLGLATRYTITVGEISRRLSHPEYLNASILGAILRKSKSKNGGVQLRDSLNQVEINLPVGRRKAYNVTSFTSLSEGESLRLSQDFNDICSSNFPSSLIGKAIVDCEIGQNKSLNVIEMILKSSIISIRMIKNILSKDRSPITTSNVSPILSEHLQEPLKRFSLLTHGFGNISVVTSLNVLENIFVEALRYLECKCQNFNSQYFQNNNSGRNNMSSLPNQFFTNNFMNSNHNLY